MSVVTDREQQLFDAALPLPSPGEREAFLERACAGDPGLHARITKLLGLHQQSDRFFTKCVSSLAAVAENLPVLAETENGKCAVGEMAGMYIDRYKLLRQLGEGGCGAVYLAEQLEPVRRHVAFKVIKLGMDTKSVVARFDMERQALAMMEHTNIARALDAGATEAGRPYFVMELVQGVKMTTFCDENKLNIRQRLDLFVQVGRAIQHAHQKGVIHRDIKPSNILVAIQDGEPVPKVIDFGIAKAIDGRLTQDTDFTTDEQLVGTPAYMSPEQAERSSLDVDTRSDIYSLGVLLYELLTGRTPFDQKELVKSGMEEMRRILREVEPRRPSAALAALVEKDLAITAENRRVEPLKLVKSLEGDLDWIVIKTLEKNRQRRYETVNALVLDILRHLNNEPVAASPPSQFYRLRKLIQRNKVIYASGVAVMLTLIIGFVVSTRFYFREREARMEAEQAQANEIILQQKTEARDKVTQAAVLINHGAMEEADALLGSIPAARLSPSTDATSVFRQMGMWNLYQRKWKPAADRFAVLVQVNQVDKSDRTESATIDLLLAAPLLIQTDDIGSYERIRRMAIARFANTTSPNAAEQVIKISMLMPADESIMKQMVPLAQLVANTLSSSDPKVNDGKIIAAWRSFALSLLEYRRGNFTGAANLLHQSLGYPGQSPACTAAAHILMSMTCLQLGQDEEADAELKLGRDMVEKRFEKKLEYGDNETGQILGWIMTPVLLNQAEALAKEHALANFDNFD